VQIPQKFPIPQSIPSHSQFSPVHPGWHWEQGILFQRVIGVALGAFGGGDFRLFNGRCANPPVQQDWIVQIRRLTAFDGIRQVGSVHFCSSACRCRATRQSTGRILATEVVEKIIVKEMAINFGVRKNSPFLLGIK
jgi:hypothetical protein